MPEDRELTATARENSFPIAFRNADERDDLLTILDFVLFHLEKYERRHPQSVGRTLFNEKYDITSLPFWDNAVRESGMHEFSPGSIQQVFNRAIKHPPEPKKALGGPDGRSFQLSKARDIRYFQWIIRERIREIKGVPEFVTAPREGPAYSAKIPSLAEVLAAKNHYEVLGLGVEATADRVKRRYRKQALLFHPDRHQDEPPSRMERYAGAFQRVNEAYRVLSNARERAEYDRKMKDGGAVRKRSRST